MWHIMVYQCLFICLWFTLHTKTQNLPSIFLWNFRELFISFDVDFHSVSMNFCFFVYELWDFVHTKMGWFYNSKTFLSLSMKLWCIIYLYWCIKTLAIFVNFLFNDVELGDFKSFSTIPQQRLHPFSGI